MDESGVEPETFRMLSERATNYATRPFVWVSSRTSKYHDTLCNYLLYDTTKHQHLWECPFDRTPGTKLNLGGTGKTKKYVFRATK